MGEKEDETKSVTEHLPLGWAAFLTTSLAAYACLRKGNYRAAFLLYSNTGGGGINIYRTGVNGKLERRFAVDYHPFWNKNTKEYGWKLHYHRGENSSQMKKHRPYEGGW